MFPGGSDRREFWQRAEDRNRQTAKLYDALGLPEFYALEGFVQWRMPAWARRLVTRGIAIVPVIFVTALYGERGTGQLLVLSQVILSMQLPFAVIPLVRFVSDRRKMGEFAISPMWAVAAWLIASFIVILNVKLLFDTIAG